MSENLFHSSLSVVTFRFCICSTTTWICFPTSVVVGFEPQRQILPKLSTKEVFLWNSWQMEKIYVVLRKFYVVLRMRGRVEELDIKKGSEHGNFRNVNHQVWMSWGHSYFPTVLFTLDALGKVGVSQDRVRRQILEAGEILYIYMIYLKLVDQQRDAGAQGIVRVFFSGCQAISWILKTSNYNPGHKCSNECFAQMYKIFSFVS